MTILDRKCRVIASDTGDLVIFVETDRSGFHVWQDVHTKKWSWSAGEYDDAKVHQGFETCADAIVAATVHPGVVVTPNLVVDLGLVKREGK